MSGGSVFHRFTMRSVRNGSRINTTVFYVTWNYVHEWLIRSETQNNHHNVYQHIRIQFWNTGLSLSADVLIPEKIYLSALGVPDRI